MTYRQRWYLTFAVFYAPILLLTLIADKAMNYGWQGWFVGAFLTISPIVLTNHLVPKPPDPE